MTDTQEIDERRARVVAENSCNIGSEGRLSDLCDMGPDCFCLRDARAIRLSDEAAGYILVKHEGVISSEDLKPVTR